MVSKLVAAIHKNLGILTYFAWVDTDQAKSYPGHQLRLLDNNRFEG
ncbi:MAG: hypothetical protein IIC84_06330 [Chloroflexi bacterium]|nr:hypothetical protein [Chloroflexota bacterium]